MGFAEVWWGLGLPILLAALGSATYLATSDSSATEFWLARVAYTVATFDALGFLTFWLWFVVKWVPLFRLALGVSTAVVLLLGMSLTIEWVDQEEVRLSETLAPKNVETPPVPAACKIPKGAVMVFLGTNLGLVTKMPSPLIEMGGQDLLVVDTDGSHRLHIDSLRILDDNNEEMARIDKDEFWVAPSVRHEKPDASTLVVYDEHNAEVLRVTYLNIQAISVTGKFRAENLPPLVISADKALLGEDSFVNSCLGELGHGDTFRSE